MVFRPSPDHGGSRLGMGAHYVSGLHLQMVVLREQEAVCADFDLDRRTENILGQHQAAQCSLFDMKWNQRHLTALRRF